MPLDPLDHARPFDAAARWRMLDAAAPLEAAPRAASYRSQRPVAGHAYRGALGVVLLMAAAIATTWLASAPVLAGLRDGAAWLAARDGERGRASATVIFAATAALALIVAWGRASATRRPVRLAGGRGRMAVEAIAQRLEASIRTRPEVRAATVVVTNRHWRGVRVEARLRVTPEARLDATITAFEAEAEALLHRRIGVPMESPPRVDVRYDELDLRAGRAHG